MTARPTDTWRTRTAHRSASGPKGGASTLGPAAGAALTEPVAGRASTGPSAGRADTGPAAGRADTGPAAGRASTEPSAARASTEPPAGRAHIDPPALVADAESPVEGAADPLRQGAHPAPSRRGGPAVAVVGGGEPVEVARLVGRRARRPGAVAEAAARRRRRPLSGERERLLIVAADHPALPYPTDGDVAGAVDTAARLLAETVGRSTHRP